MSTAYIFFFDGYISVAPTIISLSEVLLDVYDNVVVFVKDTPYGRFDFKNEKIKVIYCNTYVKPNKNMNKSKYFVHGVILYFLSNGFPRYKDLFISVDDTIFPYVVLFSKIFRAKLIYLSLELPVNNVSFLNRLLFKNLKTILTQDECRLNALFKAYHYKSEKYKGSIFFLPNSSVVEQILPQSNTPDLIQQFSDFPSDKYICSQIGMINENVFSLELVRVFDSLKDSVLVLHDRQKINFENPYVKELRKANSSNLYFSNIVYDFSELSLAYKPIHIGIALYRPADENFGLIGKASGKLSFYLKYKKPVIVNNLEGYSDLISKYNCGVVINNLLDKEEWRAAIHRIMSNYDYYSQNAYDCYLKEFDFHSKAVDFLEYLTIY